MKHVRLQGKVKEKRFWIANTPNVEIDIELSDGSFLLCKKFNDRDWDNFEANLPIFIDFYQDIKETPAPERKTCFPSPVQYLQVDTGSPVRIFSDADLMNSLAAVCRHFEATRGASFHDITGALDYLSRHCQSMLKEKGNANA